MAHSPWGASPLSAESGGILRQEVGGGGPRRDVVLYPRVHSNVGAGKEKTSSAGQWLTLRELL